MGSTFPGVKHSSKQLLCENVSSALSPSIGDHVCPHQSAVLLNLLWLVEAGGALFVLKALGSCEVVVGLSSSTQCS